MKPDDILIALQRLTECERMEFLPLAPDIRQPSVYAPVEKYLLDLKNNTKPESAAEDLFTALCEDVLGFHPTRQVGLKEGFVDFMLPERTGQLVPLELKPLFQRDGTDAVCAAELNFRKLTGTIRAFPDCVKIFGDKTPIQICSNRKRRHSTRCLPRIENTRNL